MKDEKHKNLSTDPYKGVRDFYPEDLAVQKHIFNVMRTTVESFGYQEYSASVLEPAELYAAKTGEEIVNEQTYTFTDRGDRKVTLRPEMTPTVARMVAARKRELAFPLRWYSIPNLFRYEQPQKGRLREHWQLNVDMFGSASLHADIELITIAYRIMKAFGAKDEDFEIRINSRKSISKTLEDRKLAPDQAKAIMKLVDRKAKMPEDEYLKKQADILGNDKAIVFEEGEDTRNIIAALAIAGITNARYDDSLMRGFDYYTGTIFEVFDTNPENRRSLFGGGRYDDLLSIFGSEKVPAVGFGMGDVTIRDFLELRNLIPAYTPSTELYICTIAGVDMPSVVGLAQKLRNAGVRVAVDYSDKKIGDQIKAAAKQSIPYILVIGNDELAKGEFKVKNLASGEEKPFSAIEDIAVFFLNNA